MYLILKIFFIWFHQPDFTFPRQASRRRWRRFYIFYLWTDSNSGDEWFSFKRKRNNRTGKRRKQNWKIVEESGRIVRRGKDEIIKLLKDKGDLERTRMKREEEGNTTALHQTTKKVKKKIHIVEINCVSICIESWNVIKKLPFNVLNKKKVPEAPFGLVGTVKFEPINNKELYSFIEIKNHHQEFISKYINDIIIRSPFLGKKYLNRFFN